LANHTDADWQSRLAAWAGLGALFALVYFATSRAAATVLRIDCERSYADALPIYFSVLPMTLAAMLATRALGRLVLSFVAVLAVAAAVFLLYPTRVERPEVIVGGLRDALLALRAADGDDHALPSLHVAIATLCTLHLGRWWWIWLILVWISTVLVGQHAFVDGAAGFLLALAAHKSAGWAVR
jgi:membrane-associated phospholipid phosphatase